MRLINNQQKGKRPFKYFIVLPTIVMPGKPSCSNMQEVYCMH